VVWVRTPNASSIPSFIFSSSRLYTKSTNPKHFCWWKLFLMNICVSREAGWWEGNIGKCANNLRGLGMCGGVHLLPLYVSMACWGTTFLSLTCFMTIILHMAIHGQISGLTFFSNFMFSCVYIFFCLLIYLFMLQTGYKGVDKWTILTGKKNAQGMNVGGFTVYARKLGTGYRNF
jgi:hypothetical protein